jgi:hypothetical protein
VGITAEDYEAASKITRGQRDQALKELEEQRVVAREVLAMEHLGFGKRLPFSMLGKWEELVELSRRSLATIQPTTQGGIPR